MLQPMIEDDSSLRTIPHSKDAERAVLSCALLADLIRAYEREINPARDWRDTALTEREFEIATREYRAAKQWLLTNDQGNSHRK